MDFRDLKMFSRAGRQHVQEWVGFLQGHAQLFALVPVFQNAVPLEANVRNLRDAGKVDKRTTGIGWVQGDYLYCGSVGLLVLAVRAKDGHAFVRYLDGLRERFNQPAYILCHVSGESFRVTANERTKLPEVFDGSLESLDALARSLIPAWTVTEGNFDRSISYVMMRDYQTRPRPSQEEPPTPEGGVP